MDKQQILKAVNSFRGANREFSQEMGPIVEGILDLIDEGGGGGSPDAVKYTAQELTEEQQTQARTNIGGASAASVIAERDRASAAELEIMDALDGRNAETVAVLPEASASTGGKIYYVGPDSDGEYARYRGIGSDGSYSFLPLGSTEMDLTDYATKSELNQLDQKLIDYTDTSTWENKIVTASTLAINNNASYKLSPAIQVHTGDIINVNTAGANVGVICACSSDGVLSSALVGSPSGASTTANTLYHYEVAADGYVRINYKSSVAGSYVEIINISDRIWKFCLDMSKDVDKLDVLNHSYLDAADWPTQLIAADNMYVSTNANYRASNPIAVKKGDIINVFSAGGGVALVTSCNSSGTLSSVLLATPAGASTEENKFYSVIIASDGYVRICFKYSITDSYAELMAGGGPVWKHIHELQLETIQSKTDIAALQSKHLKILVLGNSYAADSWMYVPFILLNYGVTCEISLYYRGALSLENLYNRWETNAPEDTEESGLNAGTYPREYFYIDTRQTRKVWYYAMTDATLKSAKECVELKDWDIISIQQWSGYSIDFTSYEPYANDVINLIRESMDTPYTLAWNMVCTRPTYDNIPASISAQESLYKREPVGIFLPFGTAIFNARTNPTLAALGAYAGDVEYGYPAHNLWCSDGVHIQEGIPKYTAALAIVQGIFQKYFPLLSVLGDTLRPTDQLVHDWGNLEVRGTCVGVTDANCYLAQKCAIQAVKFPFEVTTIY